MRDFEVRRGTFLLPRWRVTVRMGDAQRGVHDVFARTPDGALNMVRPLYGAHHTYTVEIWEEKRR